MSMMCSYWWRHIVAPKRKKRFYFLWEEKGSKAWIRLPTEIVPKGKHTINQRQQTTKYKIITSSKKKKLRELNRVTPQYETQCVLCRRTAQLQSPHATVGDRGRRHPHVAKTTIVYIHINIGFIRALFSILVTVKKAALCDFYCVGAA